MVKFILFFAVAENHIEYLKLYTFFNELKAFENRDTDRSVGLAKIYFFYRVFLILTSVIIAYYISLLLVVGGLLVIF